MKTRVSTLTTVAAQIVVGLLPATDREANITELLAFLEENKYPLIALDQGRGWQGFWDLPEFRVARAKHERLFASLRVEYISVRDRLAQAGIPCLSIKSGDSAPSFPYLSDNLDLLVKEEHRETARAILIELGYLELKNIEEPKKFLFCKLRGEDSISAIHLHTQVGWEVGFMDEDSLWKRARVSKDDEAVIAPSPEDVILITVAHSFYENKRFRLADIAKIRECWQSVNFDWEYLETIADQRGWLDGLLFSLLVCAHLGKTLWEEISPPDPLLSKWQTWLKSLPLTYCYYRKVTRRSPVSLPFRVSFFFSKFLYYKKILNDRHRSLRMKLYDIIQTLLSGIKLKTHIQPQPSLLVSFSGQDGSGKTCHARRLVTSLNICGLRTKYYWNRTATSRFIRFCSTCVKAAIGSRAKVKWEPPGVPGRRERLRNPLLRFFWSYLVFTDIVLSYFVHVRIPLLLGRIVVCDRYVFDAAAEMDYSLPPNDRLNRLAIKLMLALTPKPDVAYLLDVPDDVCAQRKDEDIDAIYLRCQRRAYIELAERYHLLIKRTDGDLSTLADEITQEVLIPYFDNFETFLNGLFLSNPSQLNKQRQ
jgi:dTMP kinase